MSFHICGILEPNNLLTFENVKYFKYAGFVYKVLPVLALPLMSD